jgi:hypothetical protein
MKNKFSRIYQFNITLKGIEPPVWRRIQVPETYTFWDLHIAIQDAMGWSDCHLHQFKISEPVTSAKVEIGIPDEQDDYYEILPGWKQKIADYFSPDNKTAVYTYDFGNNWYHSILLEKILPREAGLLYPLCVDGQRACPPEDCGGPSGYEDFLEIIMDPGHERYEEMLEWSGDFEPEYFDKDDVEFDDPAKRLKALWD